LKVPPWIARKSPQTQERLIGDLRLVIENAEELLKNTDQYTSVLYQNARAKLALALSAATEELARFEDARLGRMIEDLAASAATADCPAKRASCARSGRPTAAPSWRALAQQRVERNRPGPNTSSTSSIMPQVAVVVDRGRAIKLQTAAGTKSPPSN
jgi:ElaB/YqjD/DUF883 family membrane-anchored ribosome-binding protein